ncbi:hypothetical protein KL86PLE_90531 [uncultured Pleomorphomonas sp.]|uniref:Uncharacterized protein n=1 Tax=uncultured Pleomorphomonas sp. TaxID=442121 RepID=A0A212LQ11_9HYPH|nr:hypothetical protein KL86PLE_90531 [uncultured Pleomorphomonas sp.]
MPLSDRRSKGATSRPDFGYDCLPFKQDPENADEPIVHAVRHGRRCRIRPRP